MKSDFIVLVLEVSVTCAHQLYMQVTENYNTQISKLALSGGKLPYTPRG